MKERRALGQKVGGGINKAARLWAVACAIYASLVFCCSALAEDSPGKRFDLDIEATNLGDAMDALIDQTDVQLLYPYNLAEMKGLNPVKGRYTLHEALDHIFAGSGFSVGITEKGTVAVFFVQEQSREENMVSGNFKKQLLAGAAALLYGTGAYAQGTDTVNDDSDRVEERNENVPDILIVEGRSLNADIKRTRDAPQPYIVFDSTMIKNSGATTLEEFIKNRLAVNTTQATRGQTVTGSNASSINLRGLGSDETLILIDGRRTASLVDTGSPQQPDINGIPLNAIERIEILPATSSGIYGGAATGGVINVILRRDYSGAEVNLGYENTFKSDAAVKKVSFSGGFNLNNGNTNILFAGNFSDTNPLFVGDRNFLQRGRAAILDNTGGDYTSFGTSFPPVGATSNIFSADGSNLILDNGTPLNSPLTFVPYGYLGAATDDGAALVANAGKYNLDLANTADHPGGALSSLTNSPTIKSIMGSIRHSFSSDVSAYVDAFASENKGSFKISGSSLVVTLPAAASTNPFQQDIRVRVPVIGQDTETSTSWSSLRVVSGIIVSLPAAWKASGEFNWSHNTFDTFQGAGIQNPTADIVSGSIDVIRDLNDFPFDWSPYANTEPFISYPISGPINNTGFNFRFSGPVFSLPGGEVTLSTLYEHRKENFSESLLKQNLSFGTLYALLPSRSQLVKSAYGETNIPIISSANRMPGIESLDLQLSARYDHYTVNGVTGFLVSFGSPPTGEVNRSTSKTDSVSYTVALKYSPIQNLIIRGSYGTGFLPPTVNQVFGGTPTMASLSTVLDPMRGNEPISQLIEIRQGGNPDISPESSKSYSIGIIATPIETLRISVDYIKIKKTDNITQLGFQQLLNEESIFSDRITRGPNLPSDPPGFAGPITAINNTLVNIASAEVKAIDFQADYTIDLNTLGTLTLSALGTWQTDFRTQLLPTTESEQFVGLSGFPLKFKSNASAIWDYENWNIGWSMQYFDSYLVADPDEPSSMALIQRQGNGGRVPSQMYHDLFVNRVFPDIGLEITAGVNNIFNKKPPFDSSSGAAPGLYSTYGDPRLARYHINIKKAF